MNAQAVTLRTAIESIRRVTPLKSMLMPTSVPTIHTALVGHVLQIIAASTSVDASDEQPPSM
jgi:hypothetical protein